MNRFVFWLEVVYTTAGLSAFICFMVLGFYSAAVFGFVTVTHLVAIVTTNRNRLILKLHLIYIRHFRTIWILLNTIIIMATFTYNNVYITLFILVSVVSATSAHITWLHLKGRLNVWYETRELNQIFWCGFYSFGAGFVGLVYHIVSLILLQKFDMFLVTGTVWCFMTIKTGAVLMHISEKFIRDQNRPLLLAE